MSADTVFRHTGLVCAYLKRPAPVKISKLQIEKGKKELLAIRGMTEPMIRKLAPAGIYNIESLTRADPGCAAEQSGIPEDTLKNFQALARRRLENAIIEI